MAFCNGLDGECVRQDDHGGDCKLSLGIPRPISKALFSSAKEDWATPQELFDELNKEFHFVLDAAASAENAKCDCYFTKHDKTFEEKWAAFGGAVWLNYPYGADKAEKWFAKAAETAAAGATVVVLAPSRTDTRAWHKYVWDARTHEPRPNVEIRFIKGRLKFGGAKNSAPFPSVIIIFRGHNVIPF